MTVLHPHQAPLEVEPRAKVDAAGVQRTVPGDTAAKGLLDLGPVKLDVMVAHQQHDLVSSAQKPPQRRKEPGVAL